MEQEKKKEEKKAQNMKIVFLVDAFPMLTETFILNQITGLLDRGVHVEILASSPGPWRSVNQYEQYRLLERTRYYRLGVRSRHAHALDLLRRRIRGGETDALNFPMGELRAPRYLREVIVPPRSDDSDSTAEQSASDIVHCQYGLMGLRALKLKDAGVLRGRLVVSFRGFDATRFIRQNPGVYDRLFREGDLFLPVSTSLKERIVEAGCPEERIRILHSGIDCSRFSYAPRYLNAGEPVRIISVGRLVEKKGFLPGLRAVRLLREKGIPVEYTIIGEGPLKSRLERLRRKLRLSESVFLTGWQSHGEIIERMSRAHILLAPSVTASDGDMEGIPNVLKEAMAMGLPVIGTRHSGIPELVEHGKSGFLAREGDVGDLAEQLIRMISIPEQWPRMGFIGRLRVEEQFDTEELSDRLVQLYSEVLQPVE